MFQLVFIGHIIYETYIYVHIIYIYGYIDRDRDIDKDKEIHIIPCVFLLENMYT